MTILQKQQILILTTQQLLLLNLNIQHTTEIQKTRLKHRSHQRLGTEDTSIVSCCLLGLLLLYLYRCCGPSASAVHCLSSVPAAVVQLDEVELRQIEERR